MLAIELHFPAGRYHATPWGRHVNEGDVEWPPSPWRLLRALIATWHRKLDPARWPQECLAELVAALAGELPLYRLPRATRAHTRHYMPVRESRRDKPVLIFDAFVRVAPDQGLVVAWPGVELGAGAVALLDALLAGLGFLGRAESWVEARRLRDWDTRAANCAPGELSLDPASGEMREPVPVLVPRGADEYAAWRAATAAGIDWKALRPKTRSELQASLPATLLDALRLDSADLKRAGWSQPPAARPVTYQRPFGCFTPEPRVRRRPLSETAVTTVRLALAGRPLPLVENTVLIGERVRAALNRLSPRDSAAISGHNLRQDNRHGHAFYLPEDADGDGHIDHVVVHAAMGLAGTLPAFERLTRLVAGRDGEWQVVVEGYGRREHFADTALLHRGTVWESVTPYLRPWHVKPRFDTREQVRRECAKRGLAPPEVEVLEMIENTRGRRYRPVHFHRFRSKRGLPQPDRQGSFLRLTFPAPVDGPIALGFGCHFGLGLFTCREQVAAAGATG